MKDVKLNASFCFKTRQGRSKTLKCIPASQNVPPSEKWVKIPRAPTFHTRPLTAVWNVRRHAILRSILYSQSAEITSIWKNLRILTWECVDLDVDEFRKNKKNIKEIYEKIKHKKIKRHRLTEYLKRWCLKAFEKTFQVEWSNIRKNTWRTI